MYQRNQDPSNAYGNQHHLRNPHTPQAAFGGHQRQNTMPQPPAQMAPRLGQHQSQYGGPQRSPTFQQPTGSRIITLNQQHFQTRNTLHGNLLIMPNVDEPIFVMFHTDSCGVCQQVMPVYQQIAQQLPFRFAACNLTRSPQVLTMSESTISPIMHVPRLYLYARGWPYVVYKDGWQVEKLTEFMRVSWQRAVESGGGGGSAQPQLKPPPPSSNHHLPARTGHITTVEQQGHPISQYASVEGPPVSSVVTCEGDDCGDLISFNEVLCQGSHGCYTVMDTPNGPTGPIGPIG